jgi:TatA/E family protein of Tat protein translocase
MGIGGSEIFLILLIILVFFGANKIPEFARGLGKGLREFKKAAEDIKAEINNSTTDIKKEVDEIKEIRDDINKTDVTPT